MSEINPVACLFSLFALKYLLVLLMCNFSGLHFYTLSKTLTCSSDCFKGKTLLNNAFYLCVLFVCISVCVCVCVFVCVCVCVCVNS